ncbi:MAG: hypothetical protein SAK29_09645 [Scytonema sp. PMC 1069.18]|nr:hypothetical protein [Scytonema sp. PMC 1069.18]MEC4887062.1 hypothetical protein [Scytonema sp. PMC 1070.18]
MTLTLMVYSLGQLKLQQALKQTDFTLPNQKGKPTTKPTLRWILQCFQSVHLVFVDGIKTSIQLTDRQKRILQFCSASTYQYYFLS